MLDHELGEETLEFLQIVQFRLLILKLLLLGRKCF